MTCHNTRAKVAGLALDSIDLADIPRHAETAEKVVRKLRAGVMPPDGAPRPPRQDSDALISWLEAELDRVAEANPWPGEPLIRRFNRAEYANAIRDLLALELDVSTLLPADDSSEGFDNNGDVQGISPVLLERYLATAGTISELAVGDPASRPLDATYRPPPDASQNEHVDGLPLGTRGGLMIRHAFPLDADYVIKPTLWRTNIGYVRGLMQTHHVEVAMDGARVRLEPVGGMADLWPVIHDPEQAGDAIDAAAAGSCVR